MLASLLEYHQETHNDVITLCSTRLNVNTPTFDLPLQTDRQTGQLVIMIIITLLHLLQINKGRFTLADHVRI